MIALLFILGGIGLFLILLWIIFATVAGPKPKTEATPPPGEDIKNADLAELLRLREEEREKAESLKNLTLVAAARKRITEIDARLEKLREKTPFPDA